MYEEEELAGGIWRPNYMFIGNVLSFEEMMSVVDRYTKTDASGYQYVNMVKLRDDLTYNWGFDELQVTQIIFDMRDARLLT